MEKIYRLAEAAEYVGLHPKYLQQLDREGTLPARRTATNRRYYLQQDLDKHLGIEPTTLPEPHDEKQRVVLYARVSSWEQKQDLHNQVEYLKQWATSNGYTNFEVKTDIASGLNYNRKNWNKILFDGEIDILVITHKDRFVRFGYEWFARFMERQGTTVIVCNQKDTSPEQELTEDLISIVNVFGARVHGLRKYKPKRQAEGQ